MKEDLSLVVFGRDEMRLLVEHQSSPGEGRDLIDSARFFRTAFWVKAASKPRRCWKGTRGPSGGALGRVRFLGIGFFLLN